jgi:hypothetical protein
MPALRRTQISNGAAENRAAYVGAQLRRPRTRQPAGVGA